jgi:hypothetical protein
VEEFRSSQPSTIPKDLLVRAGKGMQTWELLPKHIFEKLLPRRMVNDFVHWYDVGKAVIQFRPLDSVWEEESYEWEMLKSGPHWELRHRDGACLIFPGTVGAVQFERIFAPLEDSYGLHITLTEASDCVEIHIPRFQLDFSTAKGTIIRSRQYKDMFLDDSQAIGTLIGLQSKLVLCATCGNHSGKPSPCQQNLSPACGCEDE